ncbi:hypothetical protein DUI87_09871 [Hirundo rustica rustica]|uniref:Uncharacterized protein n=1 Tax=Hirundo rustica rustica TaxID=333673 RepID=A0A3M0KGT6_HIRRU|nr:hypothetical protein DUI87_09871 [Hirundo rustica rustica]
MGICQVLLGQKDLSPKIWVFEDKQLNVPVLPTARNGPSEIRQRCQGEEICRVPSGKPEEMNAAYPDETMLKGQHGDTAAEQNPTGKYKQDTNGTEPSITARDAAQTAIITIIITTYLPRPELHNNFFTTLNLSPILCPKKQQRIPPEASATGHNPSLASQTSSTPLQLPASVQSVCKACHENNQSLFHKLALHRAAQGQGYGKGCPPASVSNSSSDVHTAMGNSRGIQLLGWFSYWFSYTFPFSLADGCPEG